MKPFLIFLGFMIHLGKAADDHSPQEEGTPDVHLKLETLEAPELRPNRQALKKTFAAECSPECIHGECVGPDECECEPGWTGPLCDTQISWPYVGDKCCNLSTTSKCLRKGGECMPRNDTCIGDVYSGPKYCDLNKLKSCKCCVPAECETLSPCAAMNGTCNVTCEGKSVSGKDFCKDDKFCKCCLPDDHVSEDCPCGQDYSGGCIGADTIGMKTSGHCMKNCTDGTVPLNRHTCNQTGGEECNCCAPLPMGSCPAPFEQHGSEYFYFHDTSKLSWYDAQSHCVSLGGSLAEPDNMEEFIALIDSSYSHMKKIIWLGATDVSIEQDWRWLSGGSVPGSFWTGWPGQPSGDGNCMEIHHHGYSGFFLNDYFCSNHGFFVCECTPQITEECSSRGEQCSEPGDFCVDKYSSPCPNGFAKVVDACHKINTTERFDCEDLYGNPCPPCDCCKNLACTSYRGRCSSAGAFCIDSVAICPKGYEEHEQSCSKPIILNGTQVKQVECKCCKPLNAGKEDQ